MRELEQDDPKNIVSFLSKHWFIIVFLGGMILTWGRFETKVSYQDLRIASLEMKQEKTDDTINSISGDIREIKTSLEFIKERLK